MAEFKLPDPTFKGVVDVKVDSYSANLIPGYVATLSYGGASVRGPFRYDYPESAILAAEKAALEGDSPVREGVLLDREAKGSWFEFATHNTQRLYRVAAASGDAGPWRYSEDAALKSYVAAMAAKADEAAAAAPGPR